MNLADAIRRASQAGSTPKDAFVERMAQLTRAETEEPMVQANLPMPTEVPIVTGECDPFSAIEPSGKRGEQVPLHTIRLEVAMGEEQFAALVRQMVMTNHAVMTLREAAALLRVPAAKVAELAESGQISGFRVDGKWRFVRSNIEQWIAAQLAA